MKWVYSIAAAVGIAGAFWCGRWSFETQQASPKAPEIGAFVMTAAQDGRMLKMDSRTGETWVLGKLTFRAVGAPVPLTEDVWQPVYPRDGFVLRDGKLYSPGGQELDKANFANSP